MKRKYSGTGFQPAAKKPRYVRQNAMPNLALKVKRLESSTEKKNIDLLSNTTIIAAQTTATTFLLNACGQGDEVNTRSGRRTTMKKMEYRFLGNVVATTVGSSPLRLLIVYDKQPNGAAPAVTDVVVANAISSMMNLNNSRRFKVLVDELIEDVTAAGGKGSWQCKGHRDFTQGGRISGLDVEFKDTDAGDITDITTGSIYAFVWQTGGLITAAPTNALYTRIRFTDK